MSENVTKALHPAAEKILSKTALREIMWTVQDKVYEGKLDEAKESMQAAIEIIGGLEGGGTTEEPEMKRATVEFTPEGYASWAAEQIVAMADEQDEAMVVKRAENFKAVASVMKAHFESENPGAPVQVEMYEAFVGTGGPGAKKMDLTAMKEQTTKADDKPKEDDGDKDDKVDSRVVEENKAFEWPDDLGTPSGRPSWSDDK